MPETLEFPAVTDPAIAYGGALGWKQNETPLPATVFVDGYAEAAFTGRTAVLGFPDYPDDIAIAETLVRLPDHAVTELSEATTVAWLESLSRAADATRARVQLMRANVRYALARRYAGTQLTAERLLTVGTAVPRPELGALRAAQEVKDWLGASWEAVATASGVNPGTIYYWQANPSANPRPATVSGLYRLNASLAAAWRACDSEAAFNEWLHVGAGSGPTPRDAALAGDLDMLRKAVQRLVFAEAPVPAAPRSRRYTEDFDDVVQDASASTVEAIPLRRKATRRQRAKRR
jgi:hypothetical protein